MTKNRIYTVVGVVIILLAIAVGIFYSTNNKKKDEPKTEPAKTEETRAIVKSTVASVENKNYDIPNSRLLTSFLIFPKGELKFDQKKGFSIKVDGLDLALLNNPEYQIKGKYPVASGEASGQITETANPKVITLSVTTLALDFSADGQVVNKDEKAKLLEKLASVGIKVPTITSTTPLQLDVNISLEDKKIKIENTSASPVVVSIEGVEK